MQHPSNRLVCLDFEPVSRRPLETTELHSAHIDYLGVVAALRGFCRELATKYEVSIEFRDDNVRKHLPKEVALCLFRMFVRQSAWRGKLGDPKTETSVRVVELSTQASENLSQFLKSWRPNERRLLFATKNGHAMGR